LRLVRPAGLEPAT